MAVCSTQDALNWLGLSSLDALAADCLQRAEQHVCDHLGWEFISQQSITEYLPLDQATPMVNDPQYIVDSGHQRAIPANYYSNNALQLRHVPVRPLVATPQIYEDWTAYFGQTPGSFPSSGLLTMGVDYFIKTEEPGISWSGQLIRRTFWFPNIPGSVKATYTAGFSDTELSGRYSSIKSAILETLADLYMRAKALGLGHFSDIASESDGGGVSVTYRDKVLNCGIPDRAAQMLERYMFCGEIAL
jgi:hypothetical protein